MREIRRRSVLPDGSCHLHSGAIHVARCDGNGVLRPDKKTTERSGHDDTGGGWFLKRNRHKGRRCLRFAVLLFSTGAAFTLVEILDYFSGPIGVVNPNRECAANPDPVTCPKRLDFDSPWGDFLLGFSALCMLAEEFSLFNTYNAVRKEVMAARGQLKQAEQEKRKISGLGQLAQEKYKKVEKSCESAKIKYRQTEECLKSTGRIQKEAGRHLNGVKKLHDAVLEIHRSMRLSEGKLARRIAIRAAFYVLVLQAILIALLVYAAGN